MQEGFLTNQLHWPFEPRTPLATPARPPPPRLLRAHRAAVPDLFVLMDSSKFCGGAWLDLWHCPEISGDQVKRKRRRDLWRRCFHKHGSFRTLCSTHLCEVNNRTEHELLTCLAQDFCGPAGLNRSRVY